MATELVKNYTLKIERLHPTRLTIPLTSLNKKHCLMNYNTLKKYGFS